MSVKDYGLDCDTHLDISVDMAIGMNLYVPSKKTQKSLASVMNLILFLFRKK